MKTFITLMISILLTTSAFGQTLVDSKIESGPSDFFSQMKAVITKHLGRPYVWGGAGMKNFDCSGFVWRVLFENGIITNRTTARKYYMMLPKVDEASQWQFGTIVFFDNLKHVGIVDSPKTFYHAQVSRGTNLSEFNSFWRQKIYGFRAIPVSSRSQQLSD